ncbi:hypothetical protein KIN20_012329 [Parelaphostrongylus tenuis]|uniref:Uncharacterized protein n=1 Tax=Parelaphostrongylus tenuis TaxID=148309 RepID=A0AAD5N0Z1_PARTN|nr:hypothetical protein KIN20_012329 [Parelaphostrongylus tenuis]
MESKEMQNLPWVRNEDTVVLYLGTLLAYEVLQRPEEADVRIDLATLTGAQSYVSGKLHAALLSNCQEWEGKVPLHQRCWAVSHPSLAL